MHILSAIEAILFVASKPLSIHQLSKAVDKGEADIIEAIESLKVKYNSDQSGIHVLVSGDEVQFATNPAYADVVDSFVKREVSGELTKAQLESLTVIAYRGPITRPELELIRGVNCAVIIRTLMMRGLVSEVEDAAKLMPAYELTTQALAELGVTIVEDLPDYESLHAHEHLENILTERE